MQSCEAPGPCHHHPTDRELVSSILEEGQLKIKNATPFKLGTKSLTLANGQEKTELQFSPLYQAPHPEESLAQSFKGMTYITAQDGKG